MVIDDDHVYGRGASDMKSGVAASMLALRAAHERGVDGRLTLVEIGEEDRRDEIQTLSRDLTAFRDRA